MSHVTHVNEIMSQLRMSHVTSWHFLYFVCSLLYTMTWEHSCTHVIESWHIWMSHVTYVNESCHTYEWVMSHIWMSHITLRMRQIATLRMSWRTYEWVMSRLIGSWHTFDESCHTYEWVMSHIWMRSCHTSINHVKDIGMGWLRLVGSLKWQVSFAEYCLFYRALLQKRPIILRSLLIEATPYHTHK